MCEPATLATLAISAAVSYAEYRQQSAATKGYNNATSQWSTSQSNSILQNTINQYTQGQTQLVEHNAEASQKITAENMQAQKSMATVQADASGRGVAGNSITALSQEYENKRDQYDADVAYNRQATDHEIMLQMQGIQSGAQSQLNDVKSNYLKPTPSPFIPIANTIGATVSAGVGSYTHNADKLAPGTNQPWYQTYAPTMSSWLGIGTNTGPQ